MQDWKLTDRRTALNTVQLWVITRPAKIAGFAAEVN